MRMPFVIVICALAFVACESLTPSGPERQVDLVAGRLRMRMPEHLSEIVGKRLLVDVRVYDSQRRLVQDLDFVGIVLSVEDGHATIGKDGNSEEVVLDIDSADLQVADEQPHSLRSTPGVAVEQPDFLLYFVRAETVVAPLGQLGTVKLPIT